MAELRATDGQVRRHRPDYWLVVIAVALAAIGLTVVYAISPALSAAQGGTGTQYVVKQLIAIVLSIVAFLITARVPLGVWRKLQVPLLVLALVGTLVAIILPVNPEYPAHRWIRLGGLSLQSVEPLKFALMLWLASFFVTRREEGSLGNSKRTLYPLIAVILAIGVVVTMIQSDFGSSVVIIAMMAAMAWLSGMPLKRIVIVGLLLAGLIAIVILAVPYRRERILSFLHPDCLNSGYQACQALISVGSGGVAGQGLGGGAQAYGYLPEAQNDSIFAIYAEKFGFVGSVALVALFGWLFARIRTIVERTDDLFARLVAAALLAWLSVQMILNVGAMVGLLPLKGITLPFVSYGGTSVLFVGAALGLVFQVSHYTGFSTRNVKKGPTHEDSHDGRGVRRPYNADSRRSTRG